jgi:hypothetical protein
MDKMSLIVQTGHIYHVQGDTLDSPKAKSRRVRQGSRRSRSIPYTFALSVARSGYLLTRHNIRLLLEMFPSQVFARGRNVQE